MEVKDVTKCAFFAVTDPELLKVDFAELDRRHAERLKEREKANPPRSEGPAEEFRKLRREIYNLTERAKSTEIYANNKAGDVKLLEQQLNTALAHKKDAVSEGNLRLERYLEHTISRLESDVAAAEKEFQRARKVSADSARLLKEWPHRERLAELEKEIGK